MGRNDTALTLAEVGPLASRVAKSMRSYVDTVDRRLRGGPSTAANVRGARLAVISSMSAMCLRVAHGPSIEPVCASRLQPMVEEMKRIYPFIDEGLLGLTDLELVALSLEGFAETLGDEVLSATITSRDLERKVPVST